MNNFNALDTIIFKKNVYNDLTNYLSNYKKIFIITSSTPQKTILPIISGFLNDKKIYFSYVVMDKKKCCHENLIKFCSLACGYDCILSLGSGSCTDLAKLTAKNLKIDYVVFPTTISHYGYFSNIAYLGGRFTVDKIECDFPKKVFIEENIIVNSPDNFVFSTVCFVFSFVETLFSEYAKYQIFNSENMATLNQLKLLINKTEELINWISLKKQSAYLNLMDNVIELFVLSQDLDNNSSMLLANLICKESNSVFGKNMLMASDLILQSYNYFWSCKLEYKNIPNIEKYMQILQKNGKKLDFLLKNIKKTDKFLSDRYIFKLKSLKPTLLTNATIEAKKMSKLCNKVLNLFSNSETKTANFNYILDNFCYTAVTSNNFQLGTMFRLGYLNIV